MVVAPVEVAVPLFIIPEVYVAVPVMVNVKVFRSNVPELMEKLVTVVFSPVTVPPVLDIFSS